MRHYPKPTKQLPEKKEESVTVSKSSWRWLGLQMVATLLPLTIVAYQVVVVVPEMQETRRVFEAEQLKEITHGKKIEALRKVQVTEGAILLSDIRESKRLVKSLNNQLKERLGE